MKVEIAVLGSQSLIRLMVSVDVKQRLENEAATHQVDGVVRTAT